MRPSSIGEFEGAFPCGCRCAALLGEGKSERSQRRFFAPFKLHVSAILKELRLKSRTQAALLASQLQAENAIRLSVGNSLKKRRTAQRGTRH